MSTPSTTVGLLVVGGGPAAYHAALAYRDLGGSGQILLVSDDDTSPYFRPPLSKGLLRGHTDADEIGLGTDDLDGIEVRTGRCVTALEPGQHRVRLDDDTVVDYRACVLATGSSPVRLPVPGGEDGAYLRTLTDARSLLGRLRGTDSAIVIGSGFIGCEAAVSLARRGLHVTVCSTERTPQAARLGDAVGDRLAGWLRTEGVRLRGGSEVTGIETVADGGRVVHVRDDDPVSAGLVLVAAGARPRHTLAAEAGLSIARGRVPVDERMRTTAPDLFAAGDVALAYNNAAGRRLAVEHWGEAETMGRIAGSTAAGADAAWDSPPGFWTELGDRTLKYCAWGDGFDDVTLDAHPGGGFSAWYRREGVLCGIATHLADDDYELGAELVRTGAPAPAAPGTAGTAGTDDVPG